MDTSLLPPDLPSETLSLTGTDIMINALRRDPQRPVIIFDESGQVVTACEYEGILSQYVQALEAIGVGGGMRVGMLSKNRPEVLYVNGALSFVDVCRVALHPMGSVDDFEYILHDSHIEALIIDPENFQDVAQTLLERVPHLKHVIALGSTQVGVDISELAAGFEKRSLSGMGSKIVRKPDDILAISYSGGTTGKPKAICATGRTAGQMLNIMMTEWEWPEVNRHLVCAPLSHGGGTMFQPTLLRGGSAVVLSGFNPKKVLDAIEKHKITTLWLVPAMIYAILDEPDLDSRDLSSVEVIYYGAASISPTRLKEAIERIGPVFFQFYGQAEAPMTVTTMRRSEHIVDDPMRLASCGRPTLGVRVALLDDDCREVPDGEPGEICVQGPLVMGGYLNKPEETAKALEGGWLHTGDVAVKDADGFLRIVDRKKDMIVTGGFNVFPREVEDVLTSHPAVAAAAVFGVPDEKWGEMVKAAVVLRSGVTVSEAELMALVREKKGPVQTPKQVIFVDAIPLSAVGKPDKKVLRVNYA